MDRQFLLGQLADSYKLPFDESQKIFEELNVYAENNNDLTTAELMHGIENDFPQLKVLHEASMRRYALVAAVNSSVIKYILVIGVIISILAGLSLLGR